jgi:erythromycin esterase
LAASLSFLLLAACSDSSTGPAEDDDPLEEEEPTWLDEWVVPVDTMDPAEGLRDLQPLKEMVGDARILGLGEVTHGTREFFLLKHRLLRYLVQEEGFRTVAFEASWALSNAINRYVTTGEGDPEELVRDLRLWPWETREVVNLVGWIRSFNKTREAGDQVRTAP